MHDVSHSELLATVAFLVLIKGEKKKQEGL